MKRPESLVKEYASRISDEEVKQLSMRLSQKIGDDYSICASFFEKDKDINKWLCTANSADEWFNMLDIVKNVMKSEKDR